ncbi:ABC transporter permease [Brevibacterium sp.]|uniref:ABC transporter permease n=1 Tax=Brevibacterium sp. TaxID=1701 RepID=UPI0025B874E2|nr:ABC transporter permease [Brevibacterium sp.]
MNETSAMRTGTAGSTLPLRRVLAQTRFETVTVLRNGEQLLLAVILPLIALFALSRTSILASLGGADAAAGGADAAQTATAGVLGLAVASTAFTGQGIQTAFDRRYGVLRQLATTPLGAGGVIAGKLGAVLCVLSVQTLLVLGCAAALGFSAAPVSWPGLVLSLLAGAAALVAWGVLMAGTLRPEATLAVANLLWVLMAAAGGLVLARDGVWGTVVGLLPPGALGDALRSAVTAGTVDWASLAILLLWALLGGLAARRWFSFD